MHSPGTTVSGSAASTASYSSPEDSSSGSDSTLFSSLSSVSDVSGGELGVTGLMCACSRGTGSARTSSR